MSSSEHTNIGIGIAIGVVALAAAFSLTVGVYLSHERARLDQRMLEHQRDELRERQRIEQQRWRERRLRDVVLLLIERGEVAEGIPLAVQMPGRREVSCRRQVRQLHRNPEREQLEQELRDEAEAALPAEVRATLHMQLSELLAHGRPADAASGPDIMQMLLDGQEPTQLSVSSSESDGEWTDSVPASSLSPLPASSLLPATATAATTTNMAATATATLTSLPTTPAPQQQQQQAVEDAHAMWQEERRAAILRELQVERQRAQRRRRTAEEVYGEGYEYVVNPYSSHNYCNSSSCSNNHRGSVGDINDSSMRTSRRRSNNNNNSITGNALDASSHMELSQSMLRRFFTTPRRARDKGGSVFDPTAPTPAGSPRLIAILPNEPSNMSWSDPYSQRVNIPY